MENAKAVGMQFGSHFKLSDAQSPKLDVKKEYTAKISYASANGSLMMYVIVCTRPDIAHEVGIVSRYTSNPGKQHWER